MAKFQTKAGTTIEIGSMTEEQAGVVALLIDAQVKPLHEQITKLNGTIETLAKLPEQITELTTRLSSAPKPEDDKSKSKDKGKDKGEGGDGDDEPAWAKRLGERLDKIENDRTSERDKSTSQSLVKSAFDAKFPNIKFPNDAMRKEAEKRLAALEPKTKDEAEKAVAGVIDELASLAGVKVDQWSAQPAKEGAKETDKNSDDQSTAVQRGIDKVNEGAKRIGAVKA